VVFGPFHFGYFDDPATDGSGPDGTPHAANELTISSWDPVSKQPQFKIAKVRVTKVADGTGPAPAPTTTASRPVSGTDVPPTTGGADAEIDERIDPYEPPAVG
jgi:hypothetical protein